MADQVTNIRTTLSAEEVVVRAVQFFSTGKWRPTGQSGRTATFQGMPPIPWGLLILMIIGYFLCIVPGIIIQLMVVKKARQFQNLVVTANPVPGGTEVVITSPPWASALVSKFVEILPPMGDAV